MKVAVIGGGPAGMISAITASRLGAEVILFEKMRSVGRKLSITGKGRCNITNASDMQEIMNNIPGNPKFLYSVFNEFNNKDVVKFFNEIGVATKVERGNRVFPVSNKALEVVDKLKKEMDKCKVKVIVNSPIKKIIVENGKIVGIQADEFFKVDKVILATGGKSYPTTGSTGDGYKLAKELGHTVTELKPSLVPLETIGGKELQGLSLKNVKVTITNGQKEIYSDFGEMLFTHFGVSGPTILSASSILLRTKNIENAMKSGDVKLHIDLKSALDFEKLEQRLIRDFEENKRKQFKNCLNDLLPSKMIPYIIERSEINPQKQIDQLTKVERRNLVMLLKNLEFKIKGFRPIEEAIITSGGINIKEINSKTMESKLVEGLYFAGEIIDVDGYTGGYNLQIAWSTGYVAGKNSSDMSNFVGNNRWNMFDFAIYWWFNIRVITQKVRK